MSEDFFYKGIFFAKMLDSINRVVKRGTPAEKFQKAAEALKAISMIADASYADLQDMNILFSGGYDVAKFFSKRYSNCPTCGARLGIMHVNTLPCNQVGGDNQYLIYCQRDFFDGQCGFEKYIKNLEEPWNKEDDQVEDEEWHPPVKFNKRKPCGDCGGKDNG